MPDRIYVTGATGRLGAAVLARVGGIPLVRKPSGLKNEVVTDFSYTQLRRILTDASAVIHLAGTVDTLDERKLRESNVSLTREIVDATPPHARIVFASSVSVYGKKLAEIPADEKTVAHPDSPYARSKFHAEQFVAEHPGHAILRISTIYGPQFEDYSRVMGMIHRGKMRIIGSGNNRIPFVHVDDVAAAIANAVYEGEGTYVIAGEPLTQKEIYSIAAKALGVEAPKGSVPLFLALAFASLREFLYRLGMAKPALTVEHVSVLGHDRAFDCSKAMRDLDFAPRPLEQGIREMAKIYKAKVALLERAKARK